MKIKRKILFGWVGHQRTNPAKNNFLYQLFYIYIPYSTLKDKNYWLFSINRWNILSLWYKDYGPRDSSCPFDWVKKTLNHHGLQNADGEIVLQTLPKFLGYAFNPVSFWLCYNKNGGLTAVICEVNNTFGEHHYYLLSKPNKEDIKDQDSLTAKKNFYVSPFFQVKGDYTFNFVVNPEHCNIKINYFVDQKLSLKTFIDGRYKDWNKKNLRKILTHYPLTTIGVIFRIHWQAIKLWIYKVPIIKKPTPPNKEITR